MLFEDVSEEALPRAAITGVVVFLLKVGDPVTVPAVTGDIVASPSGREALAVSAGMLVAGSRMPCGPALRARARQAPPSR